MFSERRNLYRILHVQPEAPVEVIKAAYRALMSTLRMHPDLGGDTATAARLNAAYATLSDAASRRAYDLSLRRPPRGAAAAAPAANASAAKTPSTAGDDWLAQRRCPFCQHRFTLAPKALSRCEHCESPLSPAPGLEATGTQRAELIGRRSANRFTRQMQGWLRASGVQREWPVQLRDLSLSGLSLHVGQPLPKGAVFRVVTPMFDAVALTVGCRAAGGQHVVHARLLTLQLVKDGKGMLVSVKV